MTTASQRPCHTCGQSITVTSRNPNRRFCSTRCRKIDWRSRQDRPHNRHAIANAVPGIDAVRNDVAPHANGVPTGNAVPAANGVQRCPNCHHQLAVIAVVVPAKAAHIPTPEVITTNAT